MNSKNFQMKSKKKCKEKWYNHTVQFVKETGKETYFWMIKKKSKEQKESLTIVTENNSRQEKLIIINQQYNISRKHWNKM